MHDNSNQGILVTKRKCSQIKVSRENLTLRSNSSFSSRSSNWVCQDENRTLRVWTNTVSNRPVYFRNLRQLFLDRNFKSCDGEPRKEVRKGALRKQSQIFEFTGLLSETSDDALQKANVTLRKCIRTASVWRFEYLAPRLVEMCLIFVGLTDSTKLKFRMKYWNENSEIWFWNSEFLDKLEEAPE